MNISVLCQAVTIISVDKEIGQVTDCKTVKTTFNLSNCSSTEGNDIFKHLLSLDDLSLPLTWPHPYLLTSSFTAYRDHATLLL